MDALTSMLRRFGGVITAPRRTIAALDPEVGHRDGLILGSLYVFAVGTFALIESAASIAATRDFNALIMLASTLGRLGVPPILILVAAETLLGSSRSYRRGLALVPLVMLAVISHELAAAGIQLPSYSAEVAGGILGLLLTIRFRPVVPPISDQDNRTSATAEGEDQA
ncbi:MAG: hypothetical protein JKY37_03410 [Nannocystaceae bacterium]|nr:hypothetical protein [Nannocystaceae bacterium]